MDADDISLNERLEIQNFFLDEYKSIDVLGSGIVNYNSGKSTCRKNSHKKHALYLLKNNTIFHPTVLIRKHSFTLKNLLYDSRVKLAEDYKLWIDCNINDLMIETLSVPLLIYRTHDMQISQREYPQQSEKVESRNKKFLIKNMKDDIEKVYKSNQ